jgi:hypothetical protein
MKYTSWKRKSIAQVLNKSSPTEKPIELLQSLEAHYLNLVLKIFF